MQAISEIQITSKGKEISKVCNYYQFAIHQIMPCVFSLFFIQVERIVMYGANVSLAASQIHYT